MLQILYMDKKTVFFRVHRRADHLEQIVDEPRQTDFLFVESHLSGFDFAHIEHIIDKIQQMPAGDRNFTEAVLDPRRIVQMRPGEGRHPDNRVHRRTDIVRHMRKKIRLCRIRVLRRFIRFPDRPVGVQFFPLLLVDQLNHKENLNETSVTPAICGDKTGAVPDLLCGKKFHTDDLPILHSPVEGSEIQKLSDDIPVSLRDQRSHGGHQFLIGKTLLRHELPDTALITDHRKGIVFQIEIIDKFINAAQGLSHLQLALENDIRPLQLLFLLLVDRHRLCDILMITFKTESRVFKTLIVNAAAPHINLSLSRMIPGISHLGAAGREHLIHAGLHRFFISRLDPDNTLPAKYRFLPPEVFSCCCPHTSAAHSLLPSRWSKAPSWPVPASLPARCDKSPGNDPLPARFFSAPSRPEAK